MLPKLIKKLKNFDFKESTRKDIDALVMMILNHKGEDKLSRDEKDEIIDVIAEMIINEKSSELFLKGINQLIHSNKANRETKEFLVHCLIESSENEISSKILKEILRENNLEIKEIIYYYHVLFPLRPIYETEEFKDSIIAYINSKGFKKTFEIRGEKYPAFGKLFAFPTLYSNCFDLTSYSSEKYKKYSKSYLAKLNLQSRINSIRVINDDNLKMELIHRYYHYYLGNLYRTRFMRVLDREFPNLQLAKKYYL